MLSNSETSQFQNSELQVMQMSIMSFAVLFTRFNKMIAHRIVDAIGKLKLTIRKHRGLSFVTSSEWCRL